VGGGGGGSHCPHTVNVCDLLRQVCSENAAKFGTNAYRRSRHSNLLTEPQHRYGSAQMFVYGLGVDGKEAKLKSSKWLGDVPQCMWLV
jgi:hypothetical protein